MMWWRAALRLVRLPQLIWLTTVWVLLWGTVTATTVVSGVVVAVLVTAVFGLPRMSGHLSVRPLRLLWLVGYLAVALVISAVEISWETLRYGPRATAGIVQVPLLTNSDQVIAAVANAVSLIPGEFMLQIDRQRGVCFVYSLGVRTPGDAQRVRRQMLALQRRVVATLGSADEVAALDQWGGGAR